MTCSSGDIDDGRFQRRLCDSMPVTSARRGVAAVRLRVTSPPYEDGAPLRLSLSGSQISLWLPG
jgi:hypothetical protein